MKKKHAHDMIVDGEAGDAMVTDNQKALKRKEAQKAISEMCLLDDNLMTLVFDRNIEATELLLNIILRRNDLKVLEVVGQREYKNPMSGGRSITIDIYAVDGNDKVYDVEVQRASEGADPHRARFHSSMIDTKMLKAGQEFKEIHDSYVIFITASDVMGAGHPLYHVNRTIEETGTYFGDGSHIIYVNGSYKDDDDPVGKLMHDFRCLSSVDMFYPVLARQVKYFKETEGGQEIMGQLFEDLVVKWGEVMANEIAEEKAKEMAEEIAKEIAEEKAKEIAEEKAKEIAEEKAKEIAEEKAKEIVEERALEEKKASARRLIARGKLTLEEIAEDTDLSIEVVRDLAGLQLV
ncbi:MAG: hypothetical protein HFH93_04590 [Lachnospiraceae bacterium]|nr:hypothetical protein [Lachnospiraceae bacterium]